MPATWKTVRVFISSTFRDMQAERDHLVRFVFPRMREELLPRGIHLVDVDLRWGVTSEQDASEVCREIITECRPRFLCILGGRYGWVPPGKDRSITADEVYYGVVDRTLKDRGFAYFYFRDDTASAAMIETTPGELREPRGSDSQNKLAELKQAIIAEGLNPVTYPAQWDTESRRLTGLKVFGDRVVDDLLSSMRSDPELRDRFVTDTSAPPDEFAEENAAMEAFVEERSERFVLGSRETTLEELLAHANGTDGNGYVCVTGTPGSGKSALLAHLSRHPTLNSQPSTLLIRHFVGASPGSTDMRRTLRRLCHELKAAYPEIKANIPDDPEKLRLAFADFLRQACARHRVVILLDGVNQFDPASHSARLHWLPQELPANGRVILSALDGPALEQLRRRSRKPREIELKLLTAEDSEAIIEQFRQRYHKKLEPDQRAALLAKTDAGTPLFVLGALEELRTLGTYEEISERIAELPPTTHELFAWILERLENDDGFRDAGGRRVGRELVSRFAALLSASRYGLSQRELADLLIPGDPQGNVAALLHLLRPYLMRRGELLDFYHGQFRAAAENAWLSTDAQRLTAHSELANYFRGQADPDKNRSWKGKSGRPFLELPFNLIQALMWDDLETILSDLTFVEAKCMAGLTFNLVEDYDAAMRKWPAEAWPPARSASTTVIPLHAPFPVRAFGHFVFQHASALARDPKQVVIFGRNYATSGPVVDAAEKILRNRSWKGQPWIELVDRPPFIEHPSLLHNLEGHEGEVTAVAVSADGHRAVSVSMDGTARVWNVEFGFCERTILAHEQGVNGVALTPTGEVAATAGIDGLVKIWDVESGDCRHAISADPREALSVVLNARATLACIGGMDGRIGVWNIATGVRMHELRGHFGPVSALALSEDEHTLVSGSWDCMVRVWNVDEWRCDACLLGHEVPVHGVAVDQTGFRIASCAGIPPDGDGRVSRQQLLQSDVRIWEYHTEAYRLQPHTIGDRGGRFGGVLGSVVYGVGLSQDGRLGVSVGYDRIVAVHTLGNRPHSRALVGHTDSVRCAAVDALGRVALTGSTDKTVRVWDLKGETAPSQTRFRIGRVGRGKRASPATRARLLWQNTRIRLAILLPMLSLAIGCLLFPGLMAILGMTEVPISKLLSATAWAYGIFLFIEWRAVLKLDTHEWHRPLLPGMVWTLAGLLLLPLWWVFPVLNCPRCGAQLCGRRRLFHCRACGFRDQLTGSGPRRAR